MHHKTVAELARALSSREISSEELTREYLQRIKSQNGSLNAFVTIIMRR